MPITKAVAVVMGTHEHMEALVVATVLWNDVDTGVVLSERDARRLRRRVGEPKSRR